MKPPPIQVAADTRDNPGVKTVLLTGASGRIGSTFYHHCRGKYAFTLCDRHEPRFAIDPTDRFIALDLTDQHEVSTTITRHDAVLHLAGIADPSAMFADLLPANILATTYLLEAAVACGCGRFVFASSAQTVEGYPRDRQISADAAPRPANMYGVSKSYGEAACAYHAGTGGISCVALRIGAFEPPGSQEIATRRDLSAWLSPRDGVHLLTRAIEAELAGFFLGYGISDNRFKRFDLTETRRVLGYAPRDDAFRSFDMARMAD
jgi:uronate dehydrogenase